MPSPPTQIVFNEEWALPGVAFGRPAILDAPYGGAKNAVIPFWLETGTSGLPDISVTQAADVALIPDSFLARCPTAKIYVRGFKCDVHGAVNWSSTSSTAGSVAGAKLIYSTGQPIVLLPYYALRGLAKYSLPQSELRIPELFGPATVNGPVGVPITTFTYVAATGVVTVGATSFVANYGIGGVARIADGTGRGQTAIITAVTATTFTVSPAFTGLDATSVIGVEYQSLAVTTDASNVTLFAGGGTPYLAAPFDSGFYMQSVLGTGLGQPTQLASVTTAGAVVLQDALTTAFVAATTLAQITNAPLLRGVIDAMIGDEYASAPAGKGISMSVNHYAGTTPLGSNLRVRAEGFIAL